MSPNLESRWTTWGTVSAVFERSSYVGIGWNPWGFLPHSLPQRIMRNQLFLRQTLPLPRSWNRIKVVATPQNWPPQALAASAAQHVLAAGHRFVDAGAAADPIGAAAPLATEISSACSMRHRGSQATEMRALLHHGRPHGGNAVAFAFRL